MTAPAGRAFGIGEAAGQGPEFRGQRSGAARRGSEASALGVRAARAGMIGILALAAAATSYGQTTGLQIDPYKVYSTIGLSTGEALRVNVVNIGGTNGYPPDPCTVQMGFTNAAGVALKASNTTIAPGHAAFLTLTFSEASAAVSSTGLRTRVNVRAVVNTLAPPCRTISSEELLDSNFGRARAYVVPVEAPESSPPPDPDFAITGITPQDTLRLNVTNITGSNGAPPDPCNVQMGFVNAAGDRLKTVGGTIEPGHTADVTITYFEAAPSSPLAFGVSRMDLRPFVLIPPPCRVAVSGELVDSFTGQTSLDVLPAVQSNTAPPPTLVNTVGQ